MDTNQPLNIALIIGSTRPGRFSEKAAAWMQEQAKKRTDLKITVLDLRDFPLPLFNEPVSPSMKNEPYTDPLVSKWEQAIIASDGFIIVTPEYNHSFPAVLKNAIDYLNPQWHKKAVGFVSYGGVGGARSIEQLRLVAVELQMVNIQKSINIFFSMYMDAISEDENKRAHAFNSLVEGATVFFDQLTWWAKLLKQARTKSS